MHTDKTQQCTHSECLYPLYWGTSSGRRRYYPCLPAERLHFRPEFINALEMFYFMHTGAIMSLRSHRVFLAEHPSDILSSKNQWLQSCCPAPGITLPWASIGNIILQMSKSYLGKEPSSQQHRRVNNVHLVWCSLIEGQNGSTTNLSAITRKERTAAQGNNQTTSYYWFCFQESGPH